MTKEEAYRYIDNLKWLKGYDNTTIGGKTVGEILDEIKTLLKEQEPVKPIRLKNWWKCPSCSGNIVANMNYCPRCGRAIKWK